jgi:hypothetical protein
MGEAKARAKAGKRNADKMITVGMVATRWDEVPDVGVATELFVASAREFTPMG